jgi:hypothetical protein
MHDSQTSYITVLESTASPITNNVMVVVIQHSLLAPTTSSTDQNKMNGLVNGRQYGTNTSQNGMHKDGNGGKDKRNKSDPSNREEGEGEDEEDNAGIASGNYRMHRVKRESPT